MNIYEHILYINMFIYIYIYSYIKNVFIKLAIRHYFHNYNCKERHIIIILKYRLVRIFLGILFIFK